MEQTKAHWQTVEPLNTHEDPLLACLLTMSKIHNNPQSEQSIRAHLPTEKDGRLTPDLFVRAAEQAGLAAKIAHRPLEKINNLVLPAVLLLNDQQACILLQLNPDETARILSPEAGTSEQTVALNVLQAEYSGHLIFVQPNYRFSDRSTEMLAKQEKNWFWSVIKESWRTYSEVAVASLLINCFALAVPLFVMNVYDRVVPNHAIETLWVLAVGVCIVFGFDFLLKSVRTYFVDIAGKTVDMKLSSKIFQQVLGVKMEARPRSVGAFVNTLQAFESFRDFITSSTLVVLIDMPFALLYIGVIAMVAGNVALIPLLMMPLVIGVGILLQLPLTELTKESFQHAAEKQATLIESLSGIEAIKTTGAEGVVQHRWEQVVKLSARLGVKLRLVSNAAVNFTALTQQLASVLVVIFGVYKIAAGELTTGALIASTILTGRALAPMAQVASLMTRYFQSINALQSVDQVMQLPVERPSEVNHLHRPHLNGDIEFREVTFAYPETEVKSLNNISVKIRRGERVGLIGRIGSGKTTFAKMLLGLYQPTSGSILIDNTDILQLDPAELRANIGYVPQDIVLFYGSVKENICLGVPYQDDQQILTAAKLAGVDNFVSQHPQGYDLQVGERGQNLSGGQRQSIALARALINNPNMLVLDEPTNAMDDSTEAQLRQNLKQHVNDRTLLIVTHKGSMLKLVDRLIVFENGKIVADGSKEAVLKALTEGQVILQR
jgi:ATP-binding cassette, subfamily C, bacterial LapB